MRVLRDSTVLAHPPIAPGRLMRLNELKSHPQKLLFDIRARSSGPTDQSKLMQQIDEELKMIERLTEAASR